MRLGKQLLISEDNCAKIGQDTDWLEYMKLTRLYQTTMKIAKIKTLHIYYRYLQQSTEIILKKSAILNAQLKSFLCSHYRQM